MNLKERREKLTEIFPEYQNFNQNRQDALAELILDLGCGQRCPEFPRFVHNCNVGDWEQATNELKFADGKSVLSRWYQDVKEERAENVLSSLRKG